MKKFHLINRIILFGILASQEILSDKSIHHTSYKSTCFNQNSITKSSLLADMAAWGAINKMIAFSITHTFYTNDKSILPQRV